MVKKKTCVFISGEGTNFKKILHRSKTEYNFPINLNLLVSNNIDAKGLKLAKKFDLPSIYIKRNKKNSFIVDVILLNELKKRQINLMILAGYMRILSSFFIRSFKGQIINIHPSLLPKYKGLNTYSKIIKNKEIRSGCTVHLVNEKLDSGKILGRKFYYLDKNSNIENVKRKTQKLEHVIYSETIINLFKYKTNF